MKKNANTLAHNKLFFATHADFHPWK